MPGRATGRSTRASSATAERKSSTTALKPRGSRSARAANAIDIPDEGPETALRTQICRIFSDAQDTTATQRKLTISLRKLQERCCFEPPETPKGRQDEDFNDFDETDFNNEVTRCVLRVLDVKKSESTGDKVIRFLLLFLVHALEKDIQIFQPEDQSEIQPTSDMPSSRLATKILTALLGFLTAKDKIVRFRATQMIAQIINSLPTVDDDVFTYIKMGFLPRLRDKEPSVRVQAALGLIRLAGTGGQDDEEKDEDEDSDEEEVRDGLIGKLVDVMVNDSSPEVRRAVLQNLSLQALERRDLLKMLERARDTDPAVRRIVYTKILPPIDFRQLTLVEREKLLRWGLRDRDDAVRKAAANLFCNHWIEVCAADRDTRDAEEKKAGEAAPPSLDALCEVLERIEVTVSGVEDGIAHDAMKAFWESRADYVRAITFDHGFWKSLDPSQAFIARSLRDYANTIEDEGLQDTLEDKMPAIVNFAYLLQTHIVRLLDFCEKHGMAEDGTDEQEDAQEDLDDQNFVVQQLLHMALTFDYSDEVGRNQVFNIMRGSISNAKLPEDCAKLCIDVLRVCCGTRGESDFCQIAWEAILDIEDIVKAPEKEDDGEESFHSAQSDISDDDASDDGQRKQKPKASVELDPLAEEEKERLEIEVYSRCLRIAEWTLQNVQCDPQSETSLANMLQNLIEPCLLGKSRRSKRLREGGALCLGLCALLSKDIATNYLDPLFRCYLEGHDELKEIVVQALVDIMITHPSLLAPPIQDPEDETPKVNTLFKPLTKMLLKSLRSYEESLSLLACTGASKLLLRGLLPAEATGDLLRALVMIYFDPDTGSRPALKQALSYFLPVYCHSQLKNAHQMAQICILLMSKLMIMKEEYDEEANDMVGWPVITAHLAEWTDGRQVFGVNGTDAEGKPTMNPAAEEPHIFLATEILERCLESTCSKDERKPLLTLLSKLYIPSSGPSPDEEALQTLHDLVTRAIEKKIGLDATQRNFLAKLEDSLKTRLGEEEQPVEQTRDSDEDTVVPNATAGAAETAPDTEVDEEEDEDTMMAGLQDEGTKFPLDMEQSNDEEEEEEVAVRPRTLAISESDIVDSLLDSELDD